MSKNKFSLVSRGLRYKLKISFYLMSILPILLCIYLVSNYILPQEGYKLDMTISTLIAIVLITIFISLIGLFIIKEIFDRIVSITSGTKLIASGDFSHRFKVEHADEVGVLGDTLNHLTTHIRSNMEELKSYSEKTTEINLEIRERVVVLSSLLQISSLISQGAKLDEILNLTVEKVRLLAKSDAAYLLFKEERQDNLYMKASAGIDTGYLIKMNIESEESLFNKLIKEGKPLILDKDNVLPENMAVDFYEKFGAKNSLALPVILDEKVIAIVGICNRRESFSYRKEDLGLLDIFTKQIAIAIENDTLTRRVEKLEIKDALTGLYNEAFIRSRLQEEIKRAITYQRPCSFMLLDVDNFKIYVRNFGSAQSEAVLKKIAYLIRDSVTEIDRVGRISDDVFAILLPEKNKRRAQDIAEDIRKKIEFAFSEEADINKRITVSGGVSENPLDGIVAEELISKAQELVDLAKKKGRNRIVVFKEPHV